MASQTQKNQSSSYNDNHHHAVPKPIKRQRQTPMAKRAARSLILTLIASLSLPITIIILFGSGRKYNSISPKPFWIPPLWTIHTSTLVCSFLMGLSGWLIWADGGFHNNVGCLDPLPMYVSQISSSITWYPLVLKIGALRSGLFFSILNFGTIFACYVVFRKINPIASALVKPCLVWAGFLSVVTLRLIYL